MILHYKLQHQSFLIVHNSKLAPLKLKSFHTFPAAFNLYLVAITLFIYLLWIPYLSEMIKYLSACVQRISSSTISCGFIQAVSDVMIFVLEESLTKFSHLGVRSKHTPCPMKWCHDLGTPNRVCYTQCFQ